jgi:hypothetical protein
MHRAGTGGLGELAATWFLLPPLMTFDTLASRRLGVSNLVSLYRLCQLGSVMMFRAITIFVLVGLISCARQPGRREASTVQALSGPTNTVSASQIKRLRFDSDPAIPWVHISREVQSCGRYTWVEGMTLMDLVAAAGGIMPCAGDRIGIQHTDGPMEFHSYERIRKHPKRDPVLRPGDWVWVVGDLL